jgi:hypothetical protein
VTAASQRPARLAPIFAVALAALTLAALLALPARAGAQPARRGSVCSSTSHSKRHRHNCPAGAEGSHEAHPGAAVRRKRRHPHAGGSSGDRPSPATGARGGPEEGEGSEEAGGASEAAAEAELQELEEEGEAEEEE